MKIDYWEPMSAAEVKNIPKMTVISANNSLHVEEIRMTYKGELYRSLYEISTGDLIANEKFKETIEL